MAQAAVAANLNQTLDIQADLTAQVTLDVVVALDDFTQLSSLFFGQVLNAGIRIDTGLSKDLVGRFAANARKRRSGRSPRASRGEGQHRQYVPYYYNLHSYTLRRVCKHSIGAASAPAAPHSPCVLVVLA